jgi:hypothetical protein
VQTRQFNIKITPTPECNSSLPIGGKDIEQNLGVDVSIFSGVGDSSIRSMKAKSKMSRNEKQNQKTFITSDFKVSSKGKLHFLHSL